MELTEIPGVGEKTAEALRDLDAPQQAIERGDVATLAQAPGIGAGRAARIVRSATQKRHEDTGKFLGTDRAASVYREVLDRLQSRAVTEYATQRLAALYPSGEQTRIDEVREWVEPALDRDINTDLDSALAGLEPLSEPEEIVIRDRCLATGDAETHATARSSVPEMSVELVEDTRELAELARGYSTVIALDERFAGVTVEGDIRVKPNALEQPAELVPERIIAFFATNHDRLRSAIEVHRIANTDPPLELDEFSAVLDRVDPDGGVTGDAELKRLNQALDDLDGALSAAETKATDHLRTAITERDVRIEGADLLSLAERGAGVDSLLDRELSDEYAEAVQTARNHLVDALALSDDETTIAEQVFADDPTFPVERRSAAAERLRDELRSARDQRAERRRREVATTLAEHRDACERLVRKALEIDVERAVAQFAADLDCTLPVREGRGFAIDGGRSPLLDVPIEEVEPVDYAVEDVALLSGVNSGGKTAALDLVAVITVLAHMGLPVPADNARVPAIDTLHYHAKTQGTLDAGAFEETLRRFADLPGGENRTLVLVDELESITEPGASAIIVAGILEALVEDDGATAVFVSHLAEEISEACDCDIVIDGIEATGLSEDGELIVDRSPRKNYHARSTPELIVEKLVEADEDDDRVVLYRQLLDKFE